jgi:hypothetical protein
MSRIVEETSIVRRSEAVATKVEIFWNPQTNNANIAFWVSQEITENGEFKRIEDDRRFDFRPMAVNFADIAARTFNVPVAFDAQGNVTATAAVPAMLLMGAIKQVFDELYTEKVVALETPTATPEPTLAPQPTPQQSPEPSVTPTPEPSPEPSVTPTPSAT